MFYFGLVFLALDLIGQALTPVAHSPAVAEWRAMLDSPALALVFGALLTAIVQSSSVVSGLAVLSVMEALISPGVAVWLVAGANLGTSSTALLASSALDSKARRLALLNTGFNALGVLLFATLLQPLTGFALASGLKPSEQVALVHTLFNLAAAFTALPLMPWLWPRLEHWLGRAMD